MTSVLSTGFFGDLNRITQRLVNHLCTLLSHLLEFLPLSESPNGAKYNFQYYIPDPEKAELYGTTEAALNNALEVTFAPNGRKGNNALCWFEFTEHSPSLTVMVDALKTELGKVPGSAMLGKWVEDLLQVADSYHYQIAGIQLSLLMVQKKPQIN